MYVPSHSACKLYDSDGLQWSHAAIFLPLVQFDCRENIEKDIELERRKAENPDLMEDDVDEVPCITR